MEKIGYNIGILRYFSSICIAGRLNSDLYNFKRSSEKPTTSESGGDT